jgi:hypothetical protein
VALGNTGYKRRLGISLPLDICDADALPRAAFQPGRLDPRGGCLRAKGDRSAHCRAGLRRYRLFGVFGINPHARENGLFVEEAVQLMTRCLCRPELLRPELGEERN